MIMGGEGGWGIMVEESLVNEMFYFLFYNSVYSLFLHLTSSFVSFSTCYDKAQTGYSRVRKNR